MTTATIGPAQRLRQLVAGLGTDQRELLAMLLKDSEGRNTQVRVPSQIRGFGGADPLPSAAGDVRFSLFFFSEETNGSPDRYRLLLESARLADELGFTAVWTPERHFDAFGASYPNPSVLAAALAMVTKRLQVRAGSVVMPLHNPIRVAEEWSVVDNLSGGRVAIACASGWHLADFVFAPDDYERRKDVTWRNLEVVQRLWRGETVTVRGVHGREVPVRAFPRPIQPELPVWVTASGTPETFHKAGQLGANLLTHLSAQSLETLAEHIGTYRAALAEHGRDPAAHCVTVMVHTYVAESDLDVRETVRPPMYDYLRSNLALHERQAKERNLGLSMAQFTSDDERAMLEHAFDKFYEQRALFGSSATCMRMVNRLKAAGVNEIACLVDFGLDERRVLDGVRALGALISPAATDAAVSPG